MNRPLRLGRPSAAELDAFLASVAGAGLTYAHVGSTRTAGGGRYARSIALGSTAGTFERAVAGLRAWACHGGIGATIHPPAAPLVEGTDVLVVLPVGPFRLLVPARSVAVVDEPDRFGFAYGTLPGHPERGEEGFWIERSSSGAVRATIRVEAASAWWLARLGSPIVTAVQRIALRRYLRGLQQFVEQGARP
jgi:uncharacterized protein (UPF0548 family)